MRQLAVLTIALWACGGPLALPPVGVADAGVLPDAGALPPDGSVDDGGVPGDPGADAGVSPDAGVGRPAGPTLAGCPMFPADHAWNRDVSADAVDPHSADYLAFMGASSLYLQP